MSAWAGFMLRSHKPPPAPSNHPKALRGLGTRVLILLACALFYFFSLSIRECLWEWFALYSASDQAGGCADLHTMCLSSSSRHFNLHCSKKFGTQRFLLRATLERLFQRFDCAGFPPLFRGCMCGGRTSDRKPLNLGCFNPISLGFHCWNDSAR